MQQCLKYMSQPSEKTQCEQAPESTDINLTLCWWQRLSCARCILCRWTSEWSRSAWHAIGGVLLWLKMWATAAGNKCHDCMVYAIVSIVKILWLQHSTVLAIESCIII